MESKDVLVIRTNLFLNPCAMERIRQDILKQMETGVVMLPAPCEALFVPKNVEVHVECVKEK